MKMITLQTAFTGVLVAFFLSATAANAQATRTWVSGVGDDANPCSRTAPCKTFAGAISKTAAGGEISVLDPGGYGAVTITKSISIVAVGVEGSILAAGTNGVIINAGATDFVHLEGINIEGAGTGINGVRVLQAARVSITGGVIRNFTGNGVIVENSAAISRVVIAGTLIEKCLNAVQMNPTGGMSARAELDRVNLNQNGGTGLLVNGATAIARLNDSVVTFNNTGLSATNGATLISFGNNVIANNTTNGAPTQTVPLQ